MDSVTISIGNEIFPARFRDDLAPRTCVAIRALLPFHQSLIHARWSGEACWVPLGELNLGLELESPTSGPAPGNLIFYPGGVSECEILVPYGTARFACRVGPLFGSPCITITDRLNCLTRIGNEILWEGSRPICITAET